MREAYIIGGANIDIIGRSDHSLIPFDSNIGKVVQSYGGVGRNIAENAARLGVKVHFVSIFGNDYNTPDGTNIRDYVHPLDLADAHILAVDYLKAGNPSTAFNLGSSTGFSNREILEAARKVTNKEIPAEIAPRRGGDPDVLVASSAKAREVLGWKPQFDDISKIIETAWKWHTLHPEGYQDK